MPESRNRGKKYQPNTAMSTSHNKPAKQQHPVARQHTTTEITGSIFHSNYPPPDLLEQYNQIDPSFPAKLLKLAQDESEHRRKMEVGLMHRGFFNDVFSTVVAAASCAGVFFLGYLFMTEGYATQGSAIVCTVTVALVIAFLTRRAAKSR